MNINRMAAKARKFALLLSAGVVFQATGCAFDPATLAAQLVTAVGSNLINNYLFSAFNLTP